MKFLLLLPLGALLAGCYNQRLMTDRSYQDRPKLETSLFMGEDDAVSEEGVQRILASRITFPGKVKIALLRYEGPAEEQIAITRYGYYYWRSEGYIKLQQELLDTVQTRLMGSGKVIEAAPMPSLMVPREPTVTRLRNAAVRLQADLLLVYRITSDVYYDSFLFATDQVKAYCTVEALLLDTRTGIIPFTSVATRDILVDRLESDVNREDAMKRAHKLASLAALTVVADDLVAFVKAVQ